MILKDVSNRLSFILLLNDQLNPSYGDLGFIILNYKNFLNSGGKCSFDNILVNTGPIFEILALIDFKKSF